MRKKKINNKNLVDLLEELADVKSNDLVLTVNEKTKVTILIRGSITSEKVKSFIRMLEAKFLLTNYTVSETRTVNHKFKPIKSNTFTELNITLRGN